MKKFGGTLGDIGSIENLLLAWREFERGKRDKSDVQEFSFRLMDNILALHRDLVGGVYRHGGYRAFNISDPKPRNIHKATVRDRLVHHAIYRVLYPHFDRTFIADSYSCRLEKGTHRAIYRFQSFFRKVSRNNTRTCWVLKCDIRKFFANIDHAVLMDILARHIADQSILDLLRRVVASFHPARPGVGLPLGNLTSQLLVNIYMNEFDRFAKHVLGAKHYMRYADDFVFLSERRKQLEEIVPLVAQFLSARLRLELHPDKVFIKTAASGVDFLGWVHFPDHRVLRTSTKRRMMRRIGESPTEATHASYLGLLSHGNTFKIVTSILREREY